MRYKGLIVIFLFLNHVIKFTDTVLSGDFEGNKSIK